VRAAGGHEPAAWPRIWAGGGRGASDAGTRRAWDSGSHSSACALVLLFSRCFPSFDDQTQLSLLLLPVLPFSSAGAAYDIGWCKDGWMG
jgi:hypothetical protein